MSEDNKTNDDETPKDELKDVAAEAAAAAAAATVAEDNGEFSLICFSR
jgi:hypothetical protein